MFFFLEKTFQVLLQIVLERDYAPSMRLHEVKPFELLYTTIQVCGRYI